MSDEYITHLCNKVDSLEYQVEDVTRSLDLLVGWSYADCSLKGEPLDEYSKRIREKLKEMAEEIKLEESLNHKLPFEGV